MTSTYTYPRTVAEMIPAREAEIKAHIHEATDCPSGHGPRTPRPLGQQPYEQMFCGVWFDCNYPGCYSTQLIKSRDLAHQLGEPHHDSTGWQKHDGTGWQPVSDEEAAAFWEQAAAEREERERQQAANARTSRRKR
jgi:hypothetical protein